jgi:hypothetical protein
VGVDDGTALLAKILRRVEVRISTVTQFSETILRTATMKSMRPADSRFFMPRTGDMTSVLARQIYQALLAVNHQARREERA